MKPRTWLAAAALGLALVLGLTFFVAGATPFERDDSPAQECARASEQGRAHGRAFEDHPGKGKGLDKARGEDHPGQGKGLDKARGEDHPGQGKGLDKARDKAAGKRLDKARPGGPRCR